MQDLLFPNAPIVQQALRSVMNRNEIRDRLTNAKVLIRPIYILNNAKNIVAEGKIKLDDIASAAAFKAWLKSIDQDDALSYITENIAQFLDRLNKESSRGPLTEGRFLYYMFTEGLTGTKPYPAAVDAIDRGEIILAAYCQIALQFNELKDKRTLVERAVQEALQNSKSPTTREEQPAPDVEPEPEPEPEPDVEPETASGTGPEAKEREESKAEAPRTRAPVPKEALELFTKLQGKYASLKARWTSYLNLLQAEKNSAEIPLRNAYVQFVEERNKYFSDLSTIRADAAKQNVLRALGELIQAQDAQYSARYAESLRERTLDGRKEKYRQAGAAPLMATGLPLVQPQPSNEANARLARQVERDLRLRSIALPREAINVPVVATPARMMPRTGQISTLQAVRSPYASNITLTVPMQWMSGDKIPDIRSASVLRLSPDMNYLILYRNGSSVSQYKTTMAPGTAAFYTDVMAMIGSVLKNESLWRDESPPRHTKAIYLVHAGKKAALRLYLGSAGGISAPFNVAAVMSNLGAAAGGISSRDKRQSVDILTDAKAQEEAEAFTLALAGAGIRTYEEPVRVSASSFTEGAASQSAAGSESKEEDKAIFIFTSAYEEGDVRQYIKFCDDILDDSLNILSFIVPSQIKPSDWAKLRSAQERMKPEFRFLAVLLDKAKEYRRSKPANLISLNASSAPVTVSDTKVTIMTASAAPGVLHIYLPLSGNETVNNQGFAEALMSASRNKSDKLIRVASPNVTVNKNTARKKIESTVLGAAKVSPNAALTPQSRTLISNALLTHLGYELVDDLTDPDGTNASLISTAVIQALIPIRDVTINSDDLTNQLSAQLESPPQAQENPFRRPLRNDGRRRRIEYVARAFQRVTS